MKGNPIFTVGHSNHTFDEFARLLSRHRIDAIADVRSQPYSRYSPQFDRPDLGESLKRERVAYVFLGTELGARPRDQACWDGDRVSYERLAASAAFQEGIRRVVRGARDYRLALLCAEKDPINCHRMILVCPHLKALRLEILHILADGSLETHADAERRLCRATGSTPDLFESPDATLARAYKQREADIAYTRTDDSDGHQRQREAF